jgi:glycosyltransferase involved in cell wall biosynthesis
MNQEYVLLGWKCWKLLGKKIYLWRNHAQGSWLTRLAVLVSNKVFCTSPHSFTARFKKTILMPVGIDTDFFKPDSSVVKKPNSVLFLGRISPVKRVLEFVEWFSKLEEKFQAKIAGASLERDKEYEKNIKLKVESLKLETRIKFVGAVTQDEALKLYQSHDTYVNMTPTGSMDKTILEAAACETAVKVENSDLKMFESKKGEELRDFVVENHSLEQLMNKLKREML